MECDLEIGGGDYEEIEGFDRQTLVVEPGQAIQCGECKRTIAEGASYDFATGEMDGDPFEFVTCVDCEAIAEVMFGDNGRGLGTLWSELEEENDEGNGFSKMTTACVAKVEGASAKEYLRERWMKWKGLKP